MKKLVSVLVAAVMALSLTACGTNGQEEAEKTLKGFMEAYCELDAEAMKDYIDDEKVIPKEIEEFDIDKMMRNIPAEFAGYEDELKAIKSDFVERMMETISYEVKDVEKKDGTYIFTLDITVPKSPDDIENTLAETIDKEALEQLVVDKYRTGEITEASTEKDIYKIIMPEVIKALKNALDDTEVETKTKEKELAVTKKDGKWLIDAKASDLD